MKRALLALACLLFVALTFNSEAIADEQISAQTFLKFTKVAGLEKQYNQMITLFAANFQQGMVAGFQNGIDGKDIPEETKEKLYPMVKEASENFKNIFENVFKKEVNFNDLVTNVYLPTYSKYFSEAEMTEIIKFYNSPVGKKVSELSPTLMQESSNTFNQLYGQRVQAIGGELMNKEIDSLLAKVKKLKSNR